MKKYLLAIYQPGADGDIPPRNVLDRIMQDVRSIREDMKTSGTWVFSGGLDSPSAATVLRPHGRDTHTMDGPFAESKEHIGGLTIVQVPNFDVALEWARKLVKATGLPIEVRPFLEESAG
ncbi:YciI family protein [Dyella humi]|uniref:YCII-related domain-containing protein n=1 Tax=Dyella humi TaxID=1770547 RepID=A0ABW8IGQ0_9GAMM